MEVEMLAVGDMIIDQSDDLTGVVQSISIKVVNGVKVGCIIVNWLNLGRWGTPLELAQEALDNGEWIVQNDLTNAWGLTFPQGERNKCK
jgi:hypothetical protein